MKQILNLVIALLICNSLFSQKYKTYTFKNPTAVNSTKWKFSQVLTGVDAYITVIGSKNATLERIDDSSSYPYAWQPFIKYTNTTTKSSDSSYVEFKIDFVKSSNGQP